MQRLEGCNELIMYKELKKRPYGWSLGRSGMPKSQISKGKIMKDLYLMMRN